MATNQIIKVPGNSYLDSIRPSVCLDLADDVTDYSPGAYASRVGSLHQSQILRVLSFYTSKPRKTLAPGSDGGCRASCERECKCQELHLVKGSMMVREIQLG